MDHDQDNWEPMVQTAIRRPRPKRLTDVRKEATRQFLEETRVNPNEYGEIAGDEWIDELITRLKRHNHRTGDVTPFDVQYWLETSPDFAQYFANPNVEQPTANDVVPVETERPSNLNNSSDAALVIPLTTTTWNDLYQWNRSSERGPIPNDLALRVPQPITHHHIDAAQRLCNLINAPYEDHVSVHPHERGYVVKIPPTTTPQSVFIEPTGRHAYYYEPLFY